MAFSKVGNLKRNEKAVMKLKMSRLGLSLIKNGEELVYVCISDLFLRLSEYDKKFIFKALIGSLQIDNTMRQSVFEQMLSETDVFDKEVKPFLEMLFVMEKTLQTKSLLVFPYLSVLIQELDVKLEEKLFIELIKLYEEISELIFKDQKEKENGDYPIEDILKLPKDQPIFIATRLVHFNPLAFNISVQLASPSKLTESMNDGVMKSVAGIVIAGVNNIECVPLRFKALIMRNARGTMLTLVRPIALEYKQQLLYQTYKIVGALGVLGNPLQLVNNLGEGVYSLFYFPASGFIKSPKEFSAGISRGAYSFIQNSVKGIFSSAHLISSQFAKGVSKITQDSDEEPKYERKSENVASGIISGATKFGDGIYKGITGVITKPIVGGREKGVQGFFKGLGKGVVGVVAKPVAGALNLVSDTFDGISHTPSYIRKKIHSHKLGGVPVRVARVIESNHFSEYNLEKALAQKTVLSFPHGDYAKQHEISKESASKLAEEAFLSFQSMRTGKQGVVSTSSRILIVPLKNGKITTEGDLQITSFRQAIGYNISSIRKVTLHQDKKVVTVRGTKASIRFNGRLFDSNSITKIKTADSLEASDLYESLRRSIYRRFPEIERACVGRLKWWVDVTDVLEKLIKRRNMRKLMSGDFRNIFKIDIEKIGCNRVDRLFLVVTTSNSLRQNIFDEGQPILFS